MYLSLPCQDTAARRPQSADFGRISGPLAAPIGPVV